ncbi:MAG: bifunctional phosphoribosylaminoimidazolecarboxamide formyltransferase/IMP cyclohydrolase [Bacteroidales bacterium]|nr:bifunctional phosphoribosylaminoimidazolecarboxamide formyltransferase/IMP cyclohydrolase [Bacteroidales bacterium]
MKIKTALLSVSDKTGITDFAKVLKKYNVEIISTGGTKRTLQDAGIEVTDISSVTGNPEAFGGRMKTISFNIESALLFDREKDAEEAEKLNIKPIDLVVCNLYPFEKVMKQGADFETLIENIDIGGPTMIRAAAKNFKYVNVLTQIEDYQNFIDEFESNKGVTSYEYRKELMAKAFNHTADYDAMIAQVMDAQTDKISFRLNFKEGKTLRYGENSHQKAHFFRMKEAENTYHDMNILNGKELSFNNILDISGAVNSVKDLGEIACAVVKHSNPCGLAQGKNQREVLEKAWQGDPVSAFGSIIAFNTTLVKETVEFFELTNPDKSQRKFIEVIIAPKIEEDALKYLQNHKNLRVIEYDMSKLPKYKDLRFINGTLLSQDIDNKLYDKLETVTETEFDIDKNKAIIEFGLNAIKNIKSNTIAIVKEKNENFYLTGMGAGQPNRLISTELALIKTKEFIRQDFKGKEEDFEVFYKEEIKDVILISDAFFPFPDNVELAAANGITKIVQPGGSIRDKSVIKTCNKLGISMIFTGIRHFKH